MLKLNVFGFEYLLSMSSNVDDENAKISCDFDKFPSRIIFDTYSPMHIPSNKLEKKEKEKEEIRKMSNIKFMYAYIRVVHVHVHVHVHMELQ